MICDTSALSGFEGGGEADP